MRLKFILTSLFLFLFGASLSACGVSISEVVETEAPLSSPASEMTQTTDTVNQPGPNPAQRALLSRLDSQGVAPEIENEVWLNSEPLSLVELRGKVVLVDFWTFG